MGFWKALDQVREKIGTAVGRWIDKAFGDESDASAAPITRYPRDPLWTAEAAADALPPELRGSDPD